MILYPSREAIIDNFIYDPFRGTFTRRSTGKECVTKSNGYPTICVEGRQIPRSHAVWIMETGEPPRRRLRRKGAKDDTRFEMLYQVDPDEKPQRKEIERRCEHRLGGWNNERDNAALERLAAWRERTGVSFEGITDVMTLRLLDPGEDA